MFANVIPPYNIICRLAALHSHHLHPVEAPQCMRDQRRGVLIRMGVAPLVENRSLPFILPRPRSDGTYIDFYVFSLSARGREFPGKKAGKVRDLHLKA